MGVMLLDRLFRRNRGSAPAIPGVVEETSVSQPGEAAGPVSAWSPQRLAQAEALWGEGYLWPGGADEIKRLTAPFGLSAAHTIMMLGVGPGGPARTIAADLGVWVAAYEADLALVDIARKRLQRSGKALAKRATVSPWSAETPKFPQGAYHHALALDILGTPRRDAVLSAIVGAVKPGGQVMVVQSIDPETEDLNAIPSMLALLGCDVRVTEDETGRHARQALQGWKVLVRKLRGSRPAPAEAAALVAEAEYWLKRIRRTRDGRLKLMRWVALVP